MPEIIYTLSNNSCSLNIKGCELPELCYSSYSKYNTESEARRAFTINTPLIKVYTHRQERKEHTMRKAFLISAEYREGVYSLAPSHFFLLGCSV